MWKTPNVPRRVAFESPVQNNRDAAGPSSVKSKTKPARRVSLGQTIDAETGEVMETPLGKRKSTREATRINTQEVQSRMKDAENRRVCRTSLILSSWFIVDNENYTGLCFPDETSQRNETQENASGFNSCCTGFGGRKY